MLKFWIFTASLVQVVKICRVGLTTLIDTLQLKSDQEMTIQPVVSLCFFMTNKEKIRTFSCQVMRLNGFSDIDNIGADLKLKFGLSQAGAQGLARASDRARVMPTHVVNGNSKPF
jgi:hypothetical protein